MYPVSVEALTDIVSSLPPAELKAVALVGGIQRAVAAGASIPPVSHETFTEAASELIAYTSACVTLREKLADLLPVRLNSECPAWPL